MANLTIDFSEYNNSVYSNVIDDQLESILSSMNPKLINESILLIRQFRSCKVLKTSHIKDYQILAIFFKTTLSQSTKRVFI